MNSLQARPKFKAPRCLNTASLRSAKLRLKKDDKIVRTPVKRISPHNVSEASVACDTDRMDLTLKHPNIRSRLKLKADIEKALQALNTISKNDSLALFSSMKQLI